MLEILKKRPSDEILGILTLSALAVLSIFGIWIQVIENTHILPSGFGVLSVEFAITAMRMDEVIAGFISHGVLHLEVLVDVLDFVMMPGWSLLFFGIHLLGIRALKFHDAHQSFRFKSFPFLIFPLVAGGLDTIENVMIYHVLTNPTDYLRLIIPVMFIFVLGKFSLLFTSITMGAIANILALNHLIKKWKPRKTS